MTDHDTIPVPRQEWDKPTGKYVVAWCSGPGTIPVYERYENSLDDAVRVYDTLKYTSPERVGSILFLEHTGTRDRIAMAVYGNSGWLPIALC